MAITSTNNGSEVASIINQALGDAGSSVTIGNESGSSVADKLNEVFGDDLINSSQSGSQFAQAVEDGLDGLDDTNDAVVKILHISDPHGSSEATSIAKTMLSNEEADFLFVTGDVTAYASSGYTIVSGLSQGLYDDFTAIGNKLLLVPGNHDSYDNRYGTNSSGQQKTTDYLLKQWLGDNVEFGDTTYNVGGYWHKDIQLTRLSKLRIFGIDQYEITAVRRQSNYYTMYSQRQVDWFINKLKELKAKDYFIIALHEPAVQSPQQPSGEDFATYLDPYAETLRPTSAEDTDKKFVTRGLRAFGNRRDEPSQNLFPRIMEAYMAGSSLQMEYTNLGGDTSNPDVVIDEDFSDVRKATFLCYLGGHRHCDITTYLPDESQETEGGDWSDQLMSVITAAAKGVDYQMDDDLGGSGTDLPKPTNTLTYRMNLMTFDFSAQTIKIDRLGSQNTSSYGIVRDTITFPFKK